MGDAERRAHHRYQLWIPVRLELTEPPVGAAAGEDAAGRRGGVVYGVIHDVSQKGALAVVAAPLAVDQAMQVHFEVPPEGGERWVLQARVLRCTDNQHDPNGLWPHQVALEFVNAAPEIEQALRRRTSVLQGRTDSSETIVE